MAEKPNDSFVSDYLAKQRESYLQQLQSSSLPTPIGDVEPPAQPEPEVGFLGGVIDTLSRPLYAVTKTVDELLNATARQDEAERLSRQGRTGEALRTSGESFVNVLTAPARGFFSTEREDKPYTSDLIEKYSDVANRNNPNYVDRENNVDVRTKGALGFVGDVVLDPLMWVPGAQIAKAANLGLRGVRAGTKALGLGKNASKEADEVLDAAVGADRVPDSKPANLGDVAEGVQKPALAELKFSERVSEGIKRGLLPEDVVTSSLRRTVNDANIYRGKKPLKRRNQMDTFLKSWQAGRLANDLPAVSNRLEFEDWIDELVNLPEEVLGDIKVPTTVAGIKLKTGTLKEFRQKFEKLPAEEADRLWSENADSIADEVFRPLYDSFTRAFDGAPRQVDLLGRTPREIPRAEAAENVIARINELAGTERANAEQVFTRPLLNSMQRLDPEGMANFLDNAQNVLRSKGLVEGMGKITGRSAEYNLLRAFNISLADYRAAYDDLAERVDRLLVTGPAAPIDEAVENLVQDAGFLAELTARFTQIDLRSPEMVQDAATAISRALSYTFKKNFDVGDLKKRGYKPAIAKDGEIYVTDEELGAGVARILNSYNTHAQNDFYTRLSEEFGVLFRGVPARDEAGNIIANYVNGPRGRRRVYEYEQLPSYVQGGPGSKAYNAYKGFELAEMIQNATVASLKSAEDFVASKGMAIVLDVTPRGADRAIETIRFSDVIESLRMGFNQLARDNIVRPSDAARWLQLSLFNADTGMSRTHLMDAVMALTNGASRDDLLKILTSGKTRYGRKIPEGANWLAGSSKNARFGFFPQGTPVPKNVAGFTTEPLYDPRNGRLVGYYGVWNNKVLAENVADALIASRVGIENIAQVRKQQYLARGIEEFRYTAPKIAQQLTRLFKNEADARGALEATDNLGSIVIDYAKAIDATDVGAMYTAGAVRSVIPGSMRNTAQSSNDFIDAVNRGDDLFEARQKAARRDNEDYSKNYDEGLDAAEEVRANPGAYDDATAQAAALVDEIDVGNPRPQDNGYGPIVRGVMRIAAAFDAKWGMDVRNHLSAWLEFESLGVSTGTYLSKMRDLDRLRDKYRGLADGETPILTAAMREIQRAVRAGEEIPVQANPMMAEAIADLRAQVGKVFNTSGSLVRSALNTGFGRAGIPPEALNTFFARQAILGRNADGVGKLPESGSFIDANKATQDAADLGIDRLSAALNQWVDWDIENPLDFLSRSQAALHQMAAEATFVDNFALYMKNQGLAARNATEAAKQGFVKLTGGTNTHFGLLLPDNLYVDRNAADIFQRMDEAMRPSKALDSAFGKGINAYFDPILNRWKTTVTVLRPGHHVRNFVGALSLRFFTLGAKHFGTSDALAARILARRNNYTGADMLNDMELGAVPKDGEVVLSTPLGSMTARELEADIHKYLFIEGKRAEDLLDDQILKGRFSENVNKFFQFATLGAGKGPPTPLAPLSYVTFRGKTVEENALDVSWYVQHRNITAHYIQALRQASEATAKKPFVRGIADTAVPKNLDEARALALESALKNHPTPNMLSSWEKVFPRRLFPFYTWIKLASAALAEATVLNPARTVTLIPKASYNLAIAMGVDPYSMYSPYPSDQMFPSFLTDEMTGPQFKVDGKYTGFSPGFASLDIYNTFGSGVLQGTVELTNPMIRIPIELLAGARLGNQAPIRDISDYIDSTIPGINYISNVTGRSVTGLGEEQAQVAAGNKTGFDRQMSAFNWLTGASVRNYSRPNYINFAEIEARNKAAEEAKKSTGFMGFLEGLGQ
jgi:hypothetical protein